MSVGGTARRCSLLDVCVTSSSSSGSGNRERGSLFLITLIYLSIDLIKKLVYNRLVDKFSALADPTRRSILELLAERGPLPATEVYDQFQFSHPAISQHLQVLREARLVNMEKHAQRHLYQLNLDTLAELEDWVHSMTRRWNARFDRFDQVLAEEKNKRGKGGNAK